MFLIILLVLLPLAFSLGWISHRVTAIGYKQRWLAAINTIKSQEDRYRELLVTGESPKSERKKGPWSLQIRTTHSCTGTRNDEAFKGDGVFFTACHEDGQVLQLKSCWAADASPEIAGATHKECLEIVQQMNEREASCT